MRRAIEPTLRLPEAPDVIEDGEEDRRKAQAAGYPPRAPPTMGRRKSRRQRVLLAALIVEFDADSVVRCAGVSTGVTAS